MTQGQESGEGDRILTRREWIGLVSGTVVGFAGCGGNASDSSPEATATSTAIPKTSSPSPAATLSPTASLTSTATPTVSPTAVPTATESPTATPPSILLTVNRGAIDVTDLSGLVQPSARLSEFHLYEGNPGEGSVYVRWDQERFYFAADVLDSTFVNNLGSDETTWKNDAWRIEIAPGPPTGPIDDTKERLTIGETPEGPTLWHMTKPGESISREITDIPKRVTHSGNRTKMAFAIPWSAMALDYNPEMGNIWRLSLAQHDMGEVEAWRNLGGGVLGSYEPSNNLGTVRYGPPIDGENVEPA